MIREVTSSTVAEAVDLDQQAAVAVDRDQRRGLARVDLLAVADRLLGVVDAALLVRALAQPGDDLVLVGDQLDDGVEALALARRAARRGSAPGRVVRG